ITGNVSIDANGDRYSDYSFSDLDPAVDKFVEVAYYSGASNELKKVTDFHWIGGKPPRDSPICGYDNSKCPKVSRGLSTACLFTGSIGWSHSTVDVVVRVLLAEVAYYSGASNELKKVTDFHWIGGKPPRDSPICGYDNSKCPKGYPLHVYLLAASAGLILLLTLLFVFFWRRLYPETKVHL
ncbi:hypothetical protein ANCDUO_13751, partial [Ancylostoma duodenale]